MNRDVIRGLLHAPRFMPFRLHLSNRDTIDIRHPERVQVLDTCLLVATADPHHGECETGVSFSHIVRYETLPS